MKKTLLFLALLLFAGQTTIQAKVATPTHKISQTFTISQPDYKLSPYTGMTRQGWIDAATHLINGAFTYIRTIDDPMYFPKQFDKT